MFVGINLGINLRSSVSFSPSALFAAGEPGVWFDPSDVANLSWLVNQLQWTQEFDNPLWVKTTGGVGSVPAVTANFAAAPDGTMTADRVQFNLNGGTAATDQSQISQLITFSATNYTGSFWLRSNTGSNFTILLLIENNQMATFTVTPTWQRFSAVRSALGLGSNFGLRARGGFTSDAPDLLIWGAQLELGSTATTYQPITTVDAGTIERFPNAVLYQDASSAVPATIPVTTPGQPVGLMLDKSKNLLPGPELVLNGGFASSANWLPIGSNITIAGGALVITGAANNSGYYQGPYNHFTGNIYEITIVVSSITQGAVTATLGLPSPTAFNCVNITSPGTYTFRQVNYCTDNNLRIYSVGTATTASIDSVSVKVLQGNHAFQSTSAARPIYAIEPAGGRRNLLVYSGFDGAVSGTPGTTPTGWSRFLGTPDGTSTYTPNSALLGGGSIRIQTTLSRYQLGQVVPVAANTSYIISVDCNVVTGSTFNNHLDWVAPPSGSTLSYRLDGVSVLAGSVVPTGLHKLEAILSVGATAGNGTMRIGVGIQANNTGDITFSNPQLEVGSTATPYQRVGSQYDVTQAGKPSMSYLYFDGVNDAMSTSTITPGTDKAQVFTGVRKVGTNGIIIETSASASANAGAIQTYWGASFYQMISGGSVPSVILPSASPAPSTDVVSQIMDIPGDIILGRVNGTQVGQSTADQGTGNYLAYPLYLGARTGTSLLFTGHIYSVITRFGPNLPDTTITSTERWVAGKTGFYPPIITGVPTIGVS